MKLFIAGDHGAFQLKVELKTLLAPHCVIDLGTYGPERTDYPLFAAKLVRKVLETKGYGLLICGSGIGVSMAANRYRGIRAALVTSPEEARLAKAHNNANVLCVGGRLRTAQDVVGMVDAWENTPFEGGRHEKRIALFNDLGEAIET